MRSYFSLNTYYCIKKVDGNITVLSILLRSKLIIYYYYEMFLFRFLSGVRPCMAINNVSVQHDGWFLPGIMCLLRKI